MRQAQARSSAWGVIHILSAVTFIILGVITFILLWDEHAELVAGIEAGFARAIIAIMRDAREAFGYDIH